jgi:hypothetical protein
MTLFEEAEAWLAQSAFIRGRAKKHANAVRWLVATLLDENFGF